MQLRHDPYAVTGHPLANGAGTLLVVRRLWGCGVLRRGTAPVTSLLLVYPLTRALRSCGDALRYLINHSDIRLGKPCSVWRVLARFRFCPHH